MAKKNSQSDFDKGFDEAGFNEGFDESEKQDVSAPIPSSVVYSQSIDREVLETEQKVKKQSKTARRARIRIPSENSGPGMSPVPVGLNGVGYLIKRDEDVEVPEGVYNVLMAAKQQVCEIYEEYGQKKTRFRETQRYPVVFLGYVDG